MNYGRLAVIAAMLLGAMAGSALAEGNPGFERLKTLVGEWETTTQDGGRSTVTYEVVSAGSALLERIGGDLHAEADMVSVYHPDGSGLVMTHYCSAGNQPRMKAEAPGADATSLHFAFLDVTNLAKPGAGHMADLVVTFQDKDHFTQQWTWKAGEKESVETFHWARTQ